MFPKYNIEEEKKEILLRYKNLLNLCKPFMGRADIKEIRTAFDLALEAYQEIRNSDGDPYIFTSFEIARISIQELGLGKTSIICAILYQAVNDNLIGVKTIEDNFDNDVVGIIRGINVISAIASNESTLQSDNLKQFLFTLAKDVRVLLLNIGIWVYKMRNIHLWPKKQHELIILEALHLYAPLAHQMGLYNLKGELEDLSLKYTQPKTYREIDKRLQETQPERIDFVKRIIDPIKNELTNRKFKYQIKWRTKRVNSIYQKMIKQKIDFDKVYDKFAIRIIIDSKAKSEKSDCWQVYSIITDIYPPNPKRLRDWISIPKSNGYESLHTTVMSPLGKWVEIQIRTGRMDEIAEKGPAAHWRYKGTEGENELDKLLNNFREIIDQPDVNTADVLDSFQMDVYSDEVFVFTPKGDLRKLPAGSTVLDFAFDIHSDVGSKCVSAKINHKLVPIRQVLKNGDQISIITSNNQKPKADWLNMVVTSKAKAKIRKAIDEEKFRIALDGKEIIERKFKNWKIIYDDSTINKIIKHFNFKTAQDLYFAIASENFEVLDIKAFLSEIDKKRNTKESKEYFDDSTSSISKQKAGISISNINLSGVDFNFAQCCKPVFGDEIIGFVTIGRGISIHRSNCPNAKRMKETLSYRQVDVSWDSEFETIQTNIVLSGEDRAGLFQDISKVKTNDLKINVQSISVNSEHDKLIGNIKVFASEAKYLDIFIKRLTEIEGVSKAVRRDDLY